MKYLHKLAERLARLWVVPVIGLLLMTMCKFPPARSTGPTATVAKLDLSPSSLSLLTDRTTDFAVVALTANDDTVDASVNWTTSGGSISPISDVGGLQYARYRAPLQPGKYKVFARASASAVSDSSVVDVSAVPVSSVSVTPTSLSLTVGQTGQLTAAPRDASGNALTGRVITWTTSSAAVATVNGSGLVTGRGAGTATITATSEGKSGAVTITVTVAPVASVTVAPASVSLAVPVASQLTATTRDAAGNILTGRMVTWATSAAAVATVSSSGLVTARAIGTATITATSEGQIGTATVTVTAVQALHPNEPAGAVPMLTWVMDFSNVVATSPETNAQPWFWATGNPPHRLTWATTVTDPSAPVNPNKVGRLEINPSNANLPLYGNGIEDLQSGTKFVPPPGSRKVYWSYWFKYLPGFVVEPFYFKQTEMFYSTTGGTIVVSAGVSEPWGLEFYNWNGTTTTFLQGPKTLTSNVWYHVEVIIDHTTWRHQMFVNGEPYIDQIASVHGIGNPQEFGLVWVYGGGGPGLPQLNKSVYMYHDELYMSYVP